MSSVLYPTTNLKATEQLRIERGQGVYVYDREGRQYLEGMAGLWCTALGYGNEELIEAAARQMRALAYSHLFGGKTHPAAIELADRLAAMAPVADGMVFLGNSGSDANDTLVKLLRYHANVTGQPERVKIIVRERAYHGVTLAASALTGLASNHAHFALPFEALGVLRAGSAHFYRDALAGESEEEFASRRAAELESLILAQGPGTIAAFLVEPVGGAGGVLTPPAGYFEKIQAVLERYGIPMWADEVITGFGRTGNDFAATTYGLRPRMMTLAKGLSSAYMPVSAALVTREMYEALVEPSAEVGVFGHGYTYGGHPVACAVASKALEIYLRDGLFERAAAAGDYLQARLRRFAEHPLVGEVRGVGLLAALELVADKASRRAFAGNSVGGHAARAAEARGLIVRALGGNSLALCPPLIISDAQIDEIIDKLGGALDATLDYAKAEKPPLADQARGVNPV